jgi:hypothetical protein
MWLGFPIIVCYVFLNKDLLMSLLRFRNSQCNSIQSRVLDLKLKCDQVFQPSYAICSWIKIYWFLSPLLHSKTQITVNNNMHNRVLDLQVKYNELQDFVKHFAPDASFLPYAPVFYTRLHAALHVGQTPEKCFPEALKDMSRLLNPCNEQVTNDGYIPPFYLWYEIKCSPYINITYTYALVTKCQPMAPVSHPHSVDVDSVHQSTVEVCWKLLWKQVLLHLSHPPQPYYISLIIYY